MKVLQKTYMFSCRLCNYDLCEVCSGGTPCESSKTLYRYRLLDNVTAMLPTISWKAPGICEVGRSVRPLVLVRLLFRSRDINANNIF